MEPVCSCYGDGWSYAMPSGSMAICTLWEPTQRTIGDDGDSLPPDKWWSLPPCDVFSRRTEYWIAVGILLLIDVIVICVIVHLCVHVKKRAAPNVSSIAMQRLATPMTTTCAGGYDMRPLPGAQPEPAAAPSGMAPSGFPFGAKFDTNTGQPIPKFDSITGGQNW